MKKFKKFLKFTSIFLSLSLLLSVIFCLGFYFFETNGVSLSADKLSSSLAVKARVLDESGETLSPNSRFVRVGSLNQYTLSAFTSAEDKRFYRHHGVDYIRLGGALINNIKTRSFSQGASTISQQLIKNTHLSGEKTIKRKLREFKLTHELEKKFSKTEIMEMYLNSIYFGGGCYGIESAAQHYFSKPANKLSLSESAALAACINAPSIYSLEQPNGKIRQRRDLVLNLMRDYNKISDKDCEEAKREPIVINKSKLSDSGALFNMISQEAAQILNISEGEVLRSDLTIETRIDRDLEKKIEQIVSSKYSSISPSFAVIVADNRTGTISAVCASNGALSIPRQPGSLAKPLFVYAPAIEYGIISPATKILDEKIEISGYSPENADKSYHGFVSAREALAKSYNIPAVKLLNELQVSRAQEFASRLNIKFTGADNNLTIALGGMSEGVKLKTLVDAYSAFACGGNFKENKLITCIKRGDGKILYSDRSRPKRVMKDSTAYLINDMLCSTVTEGTAKRLQGTGYQLAAKTGTVGLSHSNKNTDAYVVCYTGEHTLLCYFGGGVMPEGVNGATYPCALAKEILSVLYRTHSPKNFEMPSSVTLRQINRADYNNNILSIYPSHVSPKPPISSKDTADNKDMPDALLPQNNKAILDYKQSQNATGQALDSCNNQSQTTLNNQPNAPQNNQSKLNTTNQPLVFQNNQTHTTITNQPLAPQKNQQKSATTNQPLAPQNNQPKSATTNQPLAPQNNQQKSATTNQPLASQIGQSQDKAILEVFDIDNLPPLSQSVKIAQP